MLLSAAYRQLGSTKVSDDLYLGLLKNLGSVEARRGNVDSSLLWLDLGLSFLEEREHLIVQRVDFLINKGVAFYFAKDLDKAIPLYIEANELCRTHDLKEKRTKILNNLGIFYRSLKRHQEAIGLYDEALGFRREMKDTAGVANLLLNKSIAYSYLDDHEKAFESVSEAKLLFQQLNNTNDVCLAQLTEGMALKRMGRKMEAFEILKLVNSNDACKLEPTHEILLNLNLGNLFVEFDQFNEAKKHLAIVDKYEIPDRMHGEKMEYLTLKSSILEEAKNYKQALIELRTYVDISENHSTEKNRRIVKEMETKFLTNEKEVEIKLLEADRKIVDLELVTSNQRNVNLSVALGSLLLFLASLLYMINKIRKQKNVISRANEDKEVLLREIHHRVKNNLQVVSALLNLQSRFVKNENAQEALRLGHDRVESMALIHKDLYQHDNLKGVNTKDYLEKLINSLLQSYQIDDSSIILNLDVESIWLDVDTMIPLGLMINELLSNAIKHAFKARESGELSVSLHEDNKGLNLEVKDNGVGVESLELLKTKSFGHSLIQSFARKLDADIKFVNENGLRVNLLIKDYVKVA